MVQIILGLLFLAVIVAWFFWPGGAWSKIKNSYLHLENSIDEEPIRGIEATNEGIVFSRGVDTDLKDAFTLFIRTAHPSAEEGPCLVLFSFPDEDAWKVVKDKWRTDDEYIVHMLAKTGGHWTYMTDKELRARARFSESGSKPCIMTGDAAKALKKCLDTDFAECQKHTLGAVDEILIHGKKLEEIEVSGKKTFQNDFIEVGGKRNWVMFFDGARTCFIPNGGSEEGNENGLKKNVIENYLKSPDKKICKVKS